MRQQGYCWEFYFCQRAQWQKKNYSSWHTYFLNSVTLFCFIFSMAVSNRYFLLIMIRSQHNRQKRKKRNQYIQFMIPSMLFQDVVVVVVVVVAHFTFVLTLEVVVAHSSFVLSYGKNIVLCVFLLPYWTLTFLLFLLFNHLPNTFSWTWC